MGKCPQPAQYSSSGEGDPSDHLRSTDRKNLPDIRIVAARWVKCRRDEYAFSERDHLTLRKHVVYCTDRGSLLAAIDGFPEGLHILSDLVRLTEVRKITER